MNLSKHEFALHPQLEKDCVVLGSFELCLLLLVNDSHYPWFILVPQREGIREIYELSEEDQALLLRESSAFSKALQRIFKADKLNVAALGNMVPQLHIHHIARYKNDVAWPGPIWGVESADAYTLSDIAGIVKQLQAGEIANLELSA